jgi:hypothetical protein
MKKSKQQHYGNHIRLSRLQHFILLPLGLISWIGSIVYFVNQLSQGSMDWLPVILLLLSTLTLLLTFVARNNGIVAQDRAIRVEEQLRHYLLTGQPLDSRLTLRQIIALRFASDKEFPALAKRAADEAMKPDTIKRAIQEWKADTHRV